MEHLPPYVYMVFGLTVLAAVWLFAKAAGYSKTALPVLAAWIVFQSALGISGFYSVAQPIPPRFPLLLLPPVLTIVTLFSTTAGRDFISKLPISQLTIFHVIRVPVELVLYWLFTHKAIPELMTFEGRNFDIISGLTAPFIYYFGFVRNTLGRSFVLIWNFVCLALVLAITVNALLSAPTPFQQFAFDQPNIAIQYFPFVLLPSFLVPLVIFSHLVSIRQLLAAKEPKALSH